MWTRHFKNSHDTRGTLQHLKAILNRSSVPTIPKNNVNAAEDFMNITLISYVIASAAYALNMKPIDMLDIDPSRRMDAPNLLKVLQKVVDSLSCLKGLNGQTMPKDKMYMHSQVSTYII